MDYRRLIRVSNNASMTDPVVKTDPDPSELVLLLRKLAERTSETKLPEVLEESILDDMEVNTILENALEFQKKYFENLPLSKTLVKQFVYNVPRPAYDGVKYCNIHQGTPDVLNPVILLYPFLTEEPGDSIGLYLMTLMKILDDNREVIENDAQAYLADKQYDDDVNEEDIEDVE